MNRAVFLDRDGVINKVVKREGKYVSPMTIQDFELIDHVGEAIRHLKKLSYFVFVFTNQPDIARKKLAPQILEQMSEKIRQNLLVDDIQVCPHDTVDDCACRKPRPGMIKSLAQKWNIDLGSSFVVGDTWKDIDAGKAAGCKTVLIQTVYNQETAADFKARSILEAVKTIEQQGA